MDMPTPCPKCGEIVEFTTMKNVDGRFICEGCFYDLYRDNEDSEWFDQESNNLGMVR